MAFLFLFFTVVLSPVRCRVVRPRACLNSCKRARRLEIEKTQTRTASGRITDLGHYCRSNPLDLTLFLNRPGRREAAGAFASQSVCGYSSSSWSLAVKIASQLRDGSARILDLLLLAILAALRGRKICRCRGPARVRHSEQNLPPKPRIVL